MVFDPSKYPDPPDMWSDPLKGSKSTDVPESTPENVEGLAQIYGWIGLDPAEARKVPKKLA